MIEVRQLVMGEEAKKGEVLQSFPVCLIILDHLLEFLTTRCGDEDHWAWSPLKEWSVDWHES